MSHASREKSPRVLNMNGLASFLQKQRLELETAAGDEAFLTAWLGTLDSLRSLEWGDVSEFEPFAGLFASFQRRYLGLSEGKVADRLLGLAHGGRVDPAQVFDDDFARATYDRVAEATEMVDLDSRVNLVNIGCGPFPAAALLIHRHTKRLLITAVDNEPGAVESAGGVARSCADSRLRVCLGDGVNYDYSGADVIYIANHVTPKKQVVARIAETAPTGALVFVREPHGIGLLFAEALAGPLPDRLTLIGEGSKEMTFASRHVLYEVGARA